MPRGFGRLPFFGRRSAPADASSSNGPVTVRAPIDPELAPLGPPVLLPRVIVRQLLFDATELVPAWAMPRPEPASAPPSPVRQATKPARRPKATATSTAKAAAKPRSRTRKPSGGSTGLT